MLLLLELVEHRVLRGMLVETVETLHSLEHLVLLLLQVVWVERQDHQMEVVAVVHLGTPFLMGFQEVVALVALVVLPEELEQLEEELVEMVHQQEAH